MPPRPTRKKKSTRLDARTLDALRYAARCAYTLGLEALTLGELAQDERFAVVGIARLRAWATADGWDEARRAAQEAWRRRAQAKLTSGLLRRHERQMQMLAHLHDEAARLRCQQAVQPRSWESVANVQLKAAQMMRDWSKDTAEAAARLATDGNTASAGHDGTPVAGIDVGGLGDFDDAEAQVAAHAVLRARLKSRLSSPAEPAQAQEHERAEHEPAPAEPVHIRIAHG